MLPSEVTFTSIYRRKNFFVLIISIRATNCVIRQTNQFAFGTWGQCQMNGVKSSGDLGIVERQFINGAKESSRVFVTEQT